MLVEYPVSGYKKKTTELTQKSPLEIAKPIWELCGLFCDLYGLRECFEKKEKKILILALALRDANASGKIILTLTFSFSFTAGKNQDRWVHGLREARQGASRTSSTVRLQDVHWILPIPVSDQMSCRLA